MHTAEFGLAMLLFSLSRLNVIAVISKLSPHLELTSPSGWQKRNLFAMSFSNPDQANSATSSASSGPYNLLRPLWILYVSATYLPATIWALLTSFNLRPLWTASEFKDHWLVRLASRYRPCQALILARQVCAILGLLWSEVSRDGGSCGGTIALPKCLWCMP